MEEIAKLLCEKYEENVNREGIIPCAIEDAKLETKPPYLAAASSSLKCCFVILFVLR